MPSSVGLFAHLLDRRHMLISPATFTAGLIVPREGLAIMITDKLEDIVLNVFLPLVGYSVTSGES